MFIYPALERIDEQVGRFYMTPDGPAPSVTTIMGSQSDDTWLHEWRQAIGPEEADRITRESGIIGSSMHAALEAHLLGIELPRSEDPLVTSGRSMARMVARHALRYVTKVHGIEVNLHYRDLYAGTADLVCEWSGQLAIVDYKTSRWYKSSDRLGKFGVQCAAYAIAHDEMFGTEIGTVLAIEVVRNGDIKLHRFTGSDLAVSKRTWVDMVHSFHMA